MPYRAITDWKIDARNLALRTFIVPDAESLYDEAAHAIAAWVRGGGRLVVTGAAGTRQGPAARFRRREGSILASALGVEMAPAGGAETTHRVGAGAVVWSPKPLGMSYYLDDKDRGAALPEMMRLAGPSGLVRAERLPTTVGLFLWRSADGSALFADLVNYNLDPDADTVHAAADLTFRIRLPEQWRSVQGATISPDAAPPAEVSFAAGWAEIRLPRLEHYASVRVTA